MIGMFGLRLPWSTESSGNIPQHRTKEIAAAKRIAAQIIESFRNDAVRGSEAPSRASPVCESGERWHGTSGRGLLRAGVQLLLNKAGEILKPLKGRRRKLTWTGVDQAQRA